MAVFGKVPFVQQRPILTAAVLLVFLSVSAVWMIGDYPVRLANSCLDDNPVNLTRMAEHPDDFTNDVFLTYGTKSVYLSMQNWLIILLHRGLGVAPEVSSWGLAFLQSILLGFALFQFIRTVAGRSGIAWWGFAFAWATQLWGWNLANYASDLYEAYYGQLVLPFVVFAATAILKNRYGWAFLCLAISALIHPSVTLQMIGVAGIFWLGNIGRSQWVVRGAGLFAIVLLCAVPPLWLTSFQREGVDAAYVMREVARNPHMAPWVHPAFWSTTVPSFFGFTILIIMSSRFRGQCHGEGVRWWYSTLAACLLFAVAHGAGFWFGLPRVIQGVPLRSTTLLLLFSLPLLAWYLSERISARDPLGRWAALLLTLLCAFSGQALFIGPLLALFLVECAGGWRGDGDHSSSSSRTRLWHAVGWLIMCAWILAVLGHLYADGSGEPPSRLISSWLCGVKMSSVGFGVAVCSSAILAALFSPGARLLMLERIGGRDSRGEDLRPVTTDDCRRVVAGTMVVILMVGALVNAWRIGAVTDSSLAVANYEAQVWARDKTARDAKFIAFLPWRTISRRRALNPMREPSVASTGSPEARRLNEQLVAFFLARARSEQDARQIREDLKCDEYLRLDAGGVRELGRLFGANYAIRPVELPLALEEVYRNQRLVIYRIR
jgi:hypothetical protein